MHGAIFAQNIIIGGKVINQNGEAVPFAMIHAKGTGHKVSTDIEGIYKLRLKHPVSYISVTAVGYKATQKRTNKSIREQVLDFTMIKSDTAVPYKRVFPQNTDARTLAIVRQVIKNKDLHNRAKMNAYGYEAYTKIEADVNDIGDRFMNRKFFRPFKFAFANIDSNSANKPFLPIFISETVSEYYFQKKPLAGREIIKSSKISGVSDISISQFFGSSFGETDIYGEYIMIMKRNFLSPISDGGIDSYNYYLLDSDVVDNIKCYHIRFIPRSPRLMRMEGEMWVTDSTFAVKRISMHVHGSSNINMVTGISVDHHYVPVRHNIWMLQKESLVMNFARIKKTAPQMSMRKNAWYSKFVVNNGKIGLDTLFKDGLPDISIKDSADQKSDAYWGKVRKAAGSIQDEDRVYAMIDTISSLKATRNYINLFQTFLTGFVDAGPLSIGNIYSFVGRNQIQGWHFKFATRTNVRFSKYVRLGGYVAYGMREQRVRYGAEVLGLIKRNPRISLMGSYRYDMVPNPNSPSFFTTPEFFTTYGLRRYENGSSIPIKFMYNRELKFQYYNEFKYGYSFTLGFKNQQLQPLQKFGFNYRTSYDNVYPNLNISDITVSEFSITQRFAWKERFVNYNFSHFSLGSKYPVVFFEYAFGVKRLMGSQFNYHRAAAGISDTRVIGPLGKLRWTIEAGKTSGTLPFLILPTPDASETYVSWWPAFNTIPRWQFIADRYVKVGVEHHLGGLILDRIPIFNYKLKWREVWGMRMWWGDLTNQNYRANYANMADNPNNTGLIKLQTADKVPFIEMSAGFENMFKFMRLELVWRVTHLDPRGTRFSFRRGNFGVRFGIEVQF